MSISKELNQETFRCLLKLIENGGRVSISRGLHDIGAVYGNLQGDVLFGEEEFHNAIQNGWLVSRPITPNQTEYIVTPAGRDVVGVDSSTLVAETKKCLKALIDNGGKVSISIGLTDIAAVYGNKKLNVLYGEEEFDFAVLKGWLSAQKISNSQTNFEILPAGLSAAAELTTSR